MSNGSGASKRSINLKYQTDRMKLRVGMLVTGKRDVRVQCKFDSNSA